ncbi:hypothetical protein CDL12_13619 [Handroanthus impetiginosus]|uniref:Uncharacterized protein n=1 Tax=Handroanthus impetiginosus TaxID=429701 RepID=A0A2G9H8B3_9LAMI|nr:hypothetical protein CDL12_13619 [Handroanthus impetiginosus]
MPSTYQEVSWLSPDLVKEITGTLLDNIFPPTLVLGTKEDFSERRLWRCGKNQRIVDRRFVAQSKGLNPVLTDEQTHTPPYICMLKNTADILFSCDMINKTNKIITGPRFRNARKNS